MAGLLHFLRFCLRTGLPLAALALHFVIVACFARRWDRVTALTVLPFWFWALAGLALAGVSLMIYRTRFALAICVLWLVTALVGSDETRPLLRSSALIPAAGEPADWEGQRVLRVATLNCRAGNPVSAREVLAWKPDIVLFQEAPSPSFLQALAMELYPADPPSDHCVGGYECAVLTRGKIKGYFTAVGANTSASVLNVLPCHIEIDGRLVHVVCVHLQGAVTALSLHRSATWETHYRNRQSRRAEMIAVRQWLQGIQTLKPGPVIIGGDFNAPAGDGVFRELEPEFVNAFAAAGAGWGNTYPNKSPLVRIDHLYSNTGAVPVRCRTVQTANSDHRMIVCDYLLK